MQAGVVGQVATTIQDCVGDNHNVRVRLRADQRRFAEDLLLLSVPTDKDDDNGDKILKPLQRGGRRCIPGTGPSSIRRRDLVREVRVSANTDGRPLQEVSNDINAAAAKLKLPPGYDIVAGGDTEELEIMFRNMFQALMLAVIFIYLILASQFGSFTHPLAIMLSLPLSLVGVAVMLYFTQRHAQHHEHDRPHHADGARHEERDPARRLHEPGARARGCRGTRRCCRPARRVCGRS